MGGAAGEIFSGFWKHMRGVPIIGPNAVANTFVVFFPSLFQSILKSRSHL